MKNIKRYSKKYDELYNKADKLFKKYNPCQIKNGRCIVGDKCCCGSEYKKVSYFFKCKYLKKNGCSTKCLACKVHICRDLYQILSGISSFKKFLDELDKINQESHNFGGDWDLIRKSKKEVMKKLK